MSQAEGCSTQAERDGTYTGVAEESNGDGWELSEQSQDSTCISVDIGETVLVLPESWDCAYTRFELIGMARAALSVYHKSVSQ